MQQNDRHNLFAAALRYSFPVFLGYMAIGIGFGLLLVEAGYPVWLSPLMGIFMYAGAGQYISVGLFAAGAGLGECVLVQLIVNARHMAYGLSMLKKYHHLPRYRWYMIYALTDETFALLSSLDGEEWGGRQGRFMLAVSALDHCYWVAGSVIGAVAGALIPFELEGIGFALTALFIVLMIEQVIRVKEPGIFIISAAAAVLAVIFLHGRVSLLAAMVVSFVLVQLFETVRTGRGERHD